MPVKLEAAHAWTYHNGPEGTIIPFPPGEYMALDMVDIVARPQKVVHVSCTTKDILREDSNWSNYAIKYTLPAK